MSKLFLDLETSGVEPSKHSILSIGMVIADNGLENCQTFYEEIRYDELVITPEAIAINNFGFQSQTGRVPLETVDTKAFDFVRKNFTKNVKPMVIGLNVGEFDLLFINRHMPKLASLLERRSVNLNSLIYLLADIKSLDFLKLKESLSDEATILVNQLKLGVKKHNALYDAFFHLSLYFLIKDSLT